MKVAKSGYDPEWKRAKILIVEDLEPDRMLIEELLKSEGFDNLIFAADNEQALHSAKHDKPDLILLDLMMPEVDGYQICQHLKEHEETQRIPVIIQSAASSRDGRHLAFQAGANDFLSKPLDTAEMVARLQLQISQSKLLRQLHEFRVRMDHELEDARHMLFSLIPQEEYLTDISERYGISVATHMQTSSELGGDYYDIRALASGEIISYLWDFSGHGIGSAINTFRLHSILERERVNMSNPGALLCALNNQLTEILPIEQYATMFYALWDIAGKKLRYAAAGSSPPFVLSYQKEKLEVIDSSGLPLGIVADMEYQVQEYDMQDQDVLILYSDALIETEDKEGNVFDAAAYIESIIPQVKQLSPVQRADQLMSLLLKEFNEKYADNRCDDLTISIISKKIMLYTQS